MSVNIAAVQRLYIAYFNRPADPVGLAHWVAQLSPTVPATQAQLMAIAAGFSGSAEYANLYAGQSNTQIVNSLYQNLFGRQAEPAGLTHWAGRLTAGTETFASIALQLTFSAQGTDAAAIANKLAAATAFTDALDTTPEIVGYAGTAAAASARSWLATVTHDAATLTAATAPTALNAAVAAATVTGTGVAGQTFTLTTGTDSFTGTANNDVFTANVGVVINPLDGKAINVNTAQNVDVLNGGAGIDTLNLTGSGGAVALPQLTSIEIINAQSLGALTIDTSTVAALTNLNITKAAGAVNATASATADVSVAMTAAGHAVEVAGGKNVSVSLTDVAATTNVVEIGVGSAADPVGTVSVSMTGKAYTADTANTTLSAVNVTGGTTITVNQRAAADTAAAASDTIASTITQGAIAITGNASTTAVTVTQSAAVGAINATHRTGGVTETASAKFSDLALGQTIIMGGLTLTATAAMTAAQAASAFANLVNNAAFAAPAGITAGDTQAGGAASLATYTGVFTGWTSAAAVGDTVLFTSTTANANITPNLANTGTGAVTITTTDGKAHDAGALGGRMGVVAGAVTVNDVNATIKSITIDGYGTSSTTNTAVLETLNLSNSSAAFTLADSAATLALNVQGLGTSAADAALTITLAPDTLNVKSIGNNFVNLTAASKDLNVTGTGVFDADATDLTALATVRVSESAGLRLNTGVADTVTSVDTTATTGAVTVTIEGARASYTGGAGVDNVTLVTNTALTKAIDLGAGDDQLIFGVAVTGSTKALSGGAGTDTLGMTVAHADTLDGAPQAFYTGFERLLLTDAAGDSDATAETVTINLANLGLTSHVTTRGTVTVAAPANADTLVLDNLASGGTVVTVAVAVANPENTKQTVNVKDAATGTADVLNFQLVSAASLNAGTLTAAKVETINLSSIDTDAIAHSNTLTLTADSATSVTVVGNAALTLAMTGSAKVTSIDASAMTGATGLTVTSVNTTSATTITGSSGRDVLTAATGNTADVLHGGAGNDVLVANAGLTTMTGGAGADVFRIDIASLNVNSHSTITDFAAGDLLQIAGIASFASARVVLAGTAVFQDFANAAISALGLGAAGWFQFGGNTYVVADMGTADSTTFANREDFVVMLTGLVDLTNASFNNDSDTIAL